MEFTKEDEHHAGVGAPPGMDTDLESWPTGMLLTRCGRLSERAWNRRLADLGITASGVEVLLALRNGPQSQAELAAANRTSEQSMGRTIDRLERRELVGRQPHPTDRRRTVVSTTITGERTLHAALHGRPSAASVFDRLPDHDRFRSDLIRLINLLDPDQTD